jgi:hypothetical protein
MSEPIPAEITIGGKVPAFLVPRLCHAISQQCVSLEWGDAWFRPESADDLLSARIDCDGEQVLVLRGDQANYGQLETLEGFLREHSISFDRRSDAKYEYSAELIAFRPGQKPFSLPVDSDGQITIRADVLKPIRAAFDAALVKHRAGLYRTSLQLLEQAVQDFAAALPSLPPPLTSFEIE